MKATNAAAPTRPEFDYEAALEAVAKGETYALRALYEQESSWLLGVARRIVGDRDRAQDVVQTAFLEVWRHAATYQRTLGSARGWLYTVVRHRALDELRRSGRELAVGDDIDTLVDQHATSQAGPEWQALDGEHLERCLAALDDAKRHCIVYAFVEGYTHEQIAKHLAKPVGTVKSWIRRGLLSLKECLS